MSDRSIPTKADCQAHELIAAMRCDPSEAEAAIITAFDVAREGGLVPVLSLLLGLHQQLKARIAALEARPAPTQYRGVWEPDVQYQIGDMVTRSGGLWACLSPTTDTPGGGSVAWRLCVKRGKAG